MVQTFLNIDERMCSYLPEHDLYLKELAVGLSLQELLDFPEAPDRGRFLLCTCVGVNGIFACFMVGLYRWRAFSGGNV